MFEAITSEQLPDGTTLAHYCPTELPGGYVAFKESPARLKIRAVLFCVDYGQRVTWHHWHKTAKVAAVSQDYTDPWVLI